MKECRGIPDGNRDAVGQPRGGAMSLAAERLREAEQGGNIYPVFSATGTKKERVKSSFDSFDSYKMAQIRPFSPVYEVSLYNDIDKTRIFSF